MSRHWESDGGSLPSRMWWVRVRMAAASGVVEVLETKTCGELDLVGTVLLVGFAAIILHPLVHGSLGTTILALMTPVR